MAGAVEAAQVTGQQPAVHDGFGRQLGIVEIVRHDGRALGRDFADAVCIRVQDAQFDSGQRLADGVGAKRLEVVHGQHRAGFGQAIAVGDRNSKIVEELRRRRLDECSAGDQRQQFAAEGLVHLRQQLAAELDVGLLAGQHLVDRDRRG